MSLSRIAARFSRTVVAPPRIFGIEGRDFFIHLLSSNWLHDKVITSQRSLLHHSSLNSAAFQWFGLSSYASPLFNEKTAKSGNEVENKEKNDHGSAVDASDQGEASVSEGRTEPDSATEPQLKMHGGVRRRRRYAKRTAFSDSDSDSVLETDLTRDDLLKRLVKKKQLLSSKEEELVKMKDKVLITFAEMENVKERTRRDSENAKKFAIQNFAKGLLDVADNLGWASSAAKESFSELEASKDTTGATRQLKTLLEGVEMTEKQLLEVFKKFGLEKYDPINEEFDPNRHNAVFQVPDPSKPANSVAVVLKAGYILHDRVIRPAEVGVTATPNT